MPTQAVRDYKPHPELVELCMDNGGEASRTTWWIHVCAEATVVDVAVLMHGLPCSMRAIHTGDGMFRLYPVVSDFPAPTPEELRAIMTAGLPQRLPMLLLRQAS